MALEAESIAGRIEDRNQSPDRRVMTERRGRDRRKPGNRVNRTAPRHSLMKVIGAYGCGLMAAVLVLTLLAVELVGIGLPVAALAFETAGMGAAILLLALGSLEQRLIEIRLELMMLNGGRRQGDRREGDRRDTDRREGDRRDRRAA